MKKEEMLKDYKKEEDKLCICQVLDKIEFSEIRNKLESTQFLDMYQISLVETFLKKIKFERYIWFGGIDNSERKVLIVYSDKFNRSMIEKNLPNILEVLRVQLPKTDYGRMEHRNYLGGIIKCGLSREKIGDIVVYNEGADIICIKGFGTILENSIKELDRFKNTKFENVSLEDIVIKEVSTEEIKIIVASLRLDNIVSDLVRTSRSKAVGIIEQERVFVNGKNETKQSKQIKVSDIITIRGKGRFTIKEIDGTTRSGRTVLVIEKFV